MGEYRPRNDDPAGVWNGYVLTGETREMRASRLAEVPDELRDSVRRHVETVYKIRQSHQAFLERAAKEKRLVKARKPLG